MTAGYLTSTVQSIVYITHLAGKDGQDTLVQVHDGVVAALVLVHDRVRQQANDEVVSLSRDFLKKVQMSNVEQVEGTVDVHYPVVRLKG
jgi:hypothetical protein